MVRRKLEIKKIQDKSKRQVTFTKRRQGLFRKANELCKKCDAQIAVITFSLAGNLYAWGHPRVDSILKRYMDYPAQETDDNSQENKSRPPDDKDDKDHKNKRDMGLALSLSLPADEKEDRNEALDIMKNEKPGQGHAATKSNMMMASWVMAKFDGLQMDELEQLIVEMGEMQKKVKKVVERANQMRSSA